MRTLRLLTLLVLSSLAALHARVDLLLVPPAEAIPGAVGAGFTLYLNNPTELDETFELPREIIADYASSAGHDRVRLALVSPGGVRRRVPAMSRATVRLQLTEPLKGAAGFVSLRLTQPATNAIMFALDPAAPLPPPPDVPVVPAAPAAAPSPIIPGHNLDLTSDLESTRRHISSYDPIYFAIGSRTRLNARFQFSFKYRVFEPGSPTDPWPTQLVRDAFAAYTQTSLWDLETFSKPFYDTSYKPTIFLLHEFHPYGWNNDQLVQLQAGAQHESNGKGTGETPAPSPALLPSASPTSHPADSRSLNTLYFQAKIRRTAESGLFFEVGARASAYFQIDENPDIADYRGHLELTVRGGYDRGFQLSAFIRGNPEAHGSIEFNATWPAIETPLLKRILPRTLGGYAQVQYFNGYGESLLDYDVRRKDQLRLGLMIVR